MTRLEALTLLLAMPNPPGNFGSHLTRVRDPKRDPWQVKRDLGIAYVEHRRQRWANGDISCVVSVRRLKIVRSA